MESDGITLDNSGQFVTLTGKQLGVYARQTKRGRWEYKDAAGHLYGSGMAPSAFVKSFWLRDDFIEQGGV